MLSVLCQNLGSRNEVRVAGVWGTWETSSVTVLQDVGHFWVPHFCGETSGAVVGSNVDSRIAFVIAERNTLSGSELGYQAVLRNRLLVPRITRW